MKISFVVRKIILENTWEILLICLSSSELESSEEEIPKVKFLNMNPLLPIYHNGKKTGLDTKNVVELLLQPNENAEARAVPTSANINSSFVVATSASHVMHFKNILADDLGAWTINGTKKLFYRAASKTKPVMKVAKEYFDDHKNRSVYRATKLIYYIKKMCYRNKSSPDLQKIIVYLTGK